MDEESTKHANLIKCLHKSLRRKVKNGEEVDKVWNDLLKNKELLQNYAASMYKLAKDCWTQNSSSCRVSWCRTACNAYFQGGGLLKAIRKEEKRKKFEVIRSEDIEETAVVREDINSFISGLIVDDFWRVSDLENRYILLDVGSCFNPFKELKEFHVVAVDISPATSDVITCDFLNLDFDHTVEDISQYPLLDFEEKKSRVEGCLTAGTPVLSFFDIVVFSLLLSYFPDPLQRFQCCVNAHRMLKQWGLLLIVTPDSSCQNRHAAMMRSWKTALHQIGFVRCKYEKLPHLHCMAFCKVGTMPSDLCLDELASNMYIPQDAQDCLD